MLIFGFGTLPLQDKDDIERAVKAAFARLPASPPAPPRPPGKL